MNTKFRRINLDLFAPCGMNCGICLGYLRDKNVCKGCRNLDINYAKSCVNCIIRNCGLLKMTESGFCYECEIYPCRRLKNLDKRYRTKYHMSMLENLDRIKSIGLNEFAKEEQKRWKCEGCSSMVCVHRGRCLKCGAVHNFNR